MNCGELRNDDVPQGHSVAAIANVLRGLDTPFRSEADLRIEAEFSDDCNYRYVWQLRWSDKRPEKPLLVVGLVPSTADERQDDPTVRKCIKIAADNGHDELIMLNLFAAWPTANHREAAIAGRLLDAVGPDNDRHIKEQATRVRESGGKIVAAWGNDGWSRHSQVLSLLGDEVHCFGTSRFARKGQERKSSLHGWTEERFPRHASLRGIRPEKVEIQAYPWLCS